MKTGKIWLILFVFLLVVNIGVGTFYFISNKENKKLNEKKAKIEKLKEDLNKKDAKIKKLKENLNKRTEAYIDNAKELKYLLETLLDNSKELKKYMPEYKDVDVERFEEKLRQKVVRLDMKIKEFKE